jgi:hypothetical protein
MWQVIAVREPPLNLGVVLAAGCNCGSKKENYGKNTLVNKSGGILPGYRTFRYV